MKTSRKYFVSSNETDHTGAVFGILPITNGNDFDDEAKAILSRVTVIKEAVFDKSKYAPGTKIVIVECLKREISREDPKFMTLKFGGNIAHVTTAGEYDMKNRQKWRVKFWRDLHRIG